MVIDRTLQNNRDVWLIDVNRGVPMRLTFDPNVDSNPSWSPDGGLIGFRSNRGGIFDLYQKPTGNGATETVLVASDQTKFLNDWSPDGRFLLYASADPKTSNDIWVAPLQGRSSDRRGDLTPFPFVNTAYDENAGQFSPDGRWVAYQSNESGPHGNLRAAVSRSGRTLAGVDRGWQLAALASRWTGVVLRRSRWEADGCPDHDVGIDAAAGHTSRPVPDANGWLQRRLFRPQYDVAADGRFLINHSLEDAASPITVILNWTAALKK